jgi:aryl-phospho-beta-D-glucosidase BglC (GH1 family)
VEIWRAIARRYKGEKQIVGFDLVNEPVEEATDEQLDDWRDLAERAGRAIREIDPDRVLIIEPSNWGGPQALADFEPLPLADIIYSVHMYMPHQFTHQGVFSPSPPISYPGLIERRMWDKAALESALRPVVEFQQKYGVPIYIGEFSVIRWAPGDSGYRYLKDLLEIFEQHQWHWSYHAFREWDGWSVEHGPDRADRKPTERPTDRQNLLREYFKRNEKRGQ